MAESAAVHALREAERRLVARASHWNPVRWAGSVGPDGSARSRADLVYALVQFLANLGAEAERRPPRVAPRLPSDLALPDQIRVMVADLVHARAPETTLATARASIDEAVKAL